LAKIACGDFRRQTSPRSLAAGEKRGFRPRGKPGAAISAASPLTHFAPRAILDGTETLRGRYG
jgi:hypothetical protein